MNLMQDKYYIDENFYKETLETARIPIAYRSPKKLNWENDRQAAHELKDIHDRLTNFVDVGENLLICSKHTGNGKTSSACKLLRDFARFNLSLKNYETGGSLGFMKSECSLEIYFINVPEYLQLCKKSYSDADKMRELNEINSYIERSMLLVLDDICVEGLTSNDLDILYTIVNGRVSNKLSTIYTSNFTDKDIESKLGPRISDRIVKESTVVEITHGSLRGMAGLVDDAFD